MVGCTICACDLMLDATLCFDIVVVETNLCQYYFECTRFNTYFNFSIDVSCFSSWSNSRNCLM